MTASAEMPKYLCHKIVWALAIASVVLDADLAKEDGDRETDGSALITPENQMYAPFHVDSEYVKKHNPQLGGYYVLYEDGYASFSPKEAFEGGYSPASGLDQLASAAPAYNIAAVQDQVKTQCQDGTWNYNSYMHGMANGLICALATLKGEEPIYLAAPETWLEKETEQTRDPQEAEQVGNLPPYRQRLLDECSQLDDRLSKLREFFATETFAKLHHDKQHQLQSQSNHMANYAQILHYRISEF